MDEVGNFPVHDFVLHEKDGKPGKLVPINTDREVVFVAKDTKTKRLVPTPRQLSDFVRLLASHVPDSYRHSVRYFGLLSPRARGRMQAALFALLGQCLRPRPQRLSWRDSLWKYFGVDPLVDSCGQTMLWVRRERPVIG
jgi:hypothetical protein